LPLALLACRNTGFEKLTADEIFMLPIVGRPHGYALAQREAVLNLRDPGDQPYFNLVNRQFGEEFRDALKHCRWDVNETRGATFLYRLDAFGGAVESMVYPVSDFSECMQPVVSSYRFPPPPKADYWVGIFIPGCTQAGARGQCMTWSYD